MMILRRVLFAFATLIALCTPALSANGIPLPRIRPGGVGADQASALATPGTRRRCSSRISSAMLVRESRASSANGAARATGQRRNETAYRRVWMTVEH
jgi:hypothetical protein